MAFIGWVGDLSIRSLVVYPNVGFVCREIHETCCATFGGSADDTQEDSAEG